MFLTRVPVGGFPYAPDEWRRAAAWFPVVGVGIGLAMSLVWLLALPLGATVAATLTYAVSLFITGALHEDGLADTADALGGATSRERTFEILKDSRIGSYGALAICFSILLRVVLLARLTPLAVPALVLSQVLARVPPVWLMTTLPYVSPGTAAKSREIVGATHRERTTATLIGLLVVVVLIGFGSLPWRAAIAATATVGASGVVAGLFFRRKVGGVTGDFLGAAEQVGEIAVLGALAAMLG